MLGVIGNKFSIGKETYQPYAAEIHYFRVEKRYWSICFDRIKRAGFRIIATAVPWNIHQIASRDIDFNGYDDPRKDLVVFLELAREFGFKVILRPGPWVGGQLPYGGLPKQLFNDMKIYARTAGGAEVKLPPDHGVDGGFLPSYLHSNFQFHLKNYFRAFIDITKNYVHPRGPVFMVELDYETSFARQVEPDRADYNPDVLAMYWPSWLESQFTDIKKLNTRYHEKHADFSTVEPPRKFSGIALEDYGKIVDWCKFREYILNTYLQSLEDIFTAYTVEPLFFRSLYFRPGELLPAFNLVPEDRAPFLGANVFPEGGYFDLANKARFLKEEYGFAFAASFSSGRAAVSAEREEKLSPVTDNQRRFYFAAAMSAGFKGLNHYMFVDRDHWYGAPLHADGTVSEGFEVVKNFTSSISTIGFDDMAAVPQVAVLNFRLYQWMKMTDGIKEFEILKRLLDDTTTGFCRDLTRLKLPYGVRENRDYESLKKYRLLFVPVTEIMAERDQEALVELAKAGVTLILCGLMPRFNDDLHPCTVLSNHLRIKTSADYHIGHVEHKGGSFTSHIYGAVKAVDDPKCKKIVKEEGKIIGVCTSRFKAPVYLFTFDIASGGNHHKLGFIESTLQGENFQSYLQCSDPSIDIAFQMGEKKGILFVVVPPAGELSDAFEAKTKEIIVQADLKVPGFNAAQLKLTNIMAPEGTEPIKTTAKDLKIGIPLTVSYPDGLVFLVEKRA